MSESNYLGLRYFLACICASVIIAACLSGVLLIAWGYP